MSSLKMLEQSFVSDEKILIDSIIKKNADLSKQIEGAAEVCIIGRNLKYDEFWKNELLDSSNEGKILDPFDDLPIKIVDKIEHLAVVTFLIKDDMEIMFGNTNYQLAEFVRVILIKTISTITNIDKSDKIFETMDE